MTSERELALELVRVTEAAALAAAMPTVFDAVAIDGAVVIPAATALQSVCKGSETFY